MSTGIDQQLMIGDETTVGTGVAPTLALPLLGGETLTNNIGRIESASIYKGQRVQRSSQWRPSVKDPKGHFGMELFPNAMSLLFKHMFGTIVTTGAGPYTHTCTPGTLQGKSLTIQAGKPSLGSGVVPFTFVGSKFAGWELACAEEQLATAGFDVVAMDCVTSTALATWTLPSGLGVPFSWADITTFTIGGVAQSVKSWVLKATVPFDEKRYFMGSMSRKELIENDLRKWTVDLTVEFTDTTLYDLFVAGSEAALVIGLVSGSNTVTVTTNVRFDQGTPQAQNRGILMQNISCVIEAPSGDAGGITAVLVDTTASP